MNRQSTEGLGGSENTLCNTLVMNTFVQTHEITTPRVNRSINYGFWLIMTCQYRFINFNKGTTLVAGVENHEGYFCVEQGRVFRISLYLPLILL